MNMADSTSGVINNNADSTTGSDGVAININNNVDSTDGVINNNIVDTISNAGSTSSVTSDSLTIESTHRSQTAVGPLEQLLITGGIRYQLQSE